jgi:formylglycine-generating enzyme required for sulfatase activity
MTGKEIIVLFVGLLLVVFILVMKNTANINSNEFSETETIIGISKPTNESTSSFNPTTSFPTLDIIDIPEFVLNQVESEAIDPTVLIESLNQSIEQENYFSPKQDNALVNLLKLMSVEIDDESLFAQRQQAQGHLTAILLADAEYAIDNNDVNELKLTISRLKSINKTHASIKSLQSKLSTINTINKLYENGIAQIADGEIVNDNSDGAWHIAKQCMELDPENSKSIALKEQVTSILTGQAIRAAEESYFIIADEQIKQAALLDPESLTVQSTIETVDDIKQQRYLWLEQQISLAIDKVNIEDTKKIVQQLSDLGLDQSQLKEYENEIQRMTLYGEHEPLDLFTPNNPEDLDLPAMVVMPAGEFYMGKVKGQKHELPVHKVEINYGFAVSQNEITVAQFKEFIKQTKFKTDAETNKSSRVYDIRPGSMKSTSRVTWRPNSLGTKAKDSEPVIHVSWNDVTAYIDWLSQNTNKKFRLLSESEFEYILRSGAYTKYPWGDGSPAQVIENITGKLDKTRSNKHIRWTDGFEKYNDGHWGPAPVGSFIPNPFRLNDISGNVMEWVSDCWHDSYTRAPKNGQAWINPGCDNHVIRGGSWSSAPVEFEASHRFKALKNFSDPRLGFRVALDL